MKEKTMKVQGYRQESSQYKIKKGFSLTPWQQFLIDNNVQLIQFNFPENQKLEQYSKFASCSAKSVVKIPKYFTLKCTEVFPTKYCHFKWSQYPDRGKIYRINCIQKNFSKCRRLICNFQMIYKYQDGFFKIIKSQTIHTHYSAKTTFQQILSITKIYRNKQNLQRMAKQQQLKLLLRTKERVLPKPEFQDQINNEVDQCNSEALLEDSDIYQSNQKNMYQQRKQFSQKNEEDEQEEQSVQGQESEKEEEQQEQPN